MRTPTALLVIMLTLALAAGAAWPLMALGDVFIGVGHDPTDLSGAPWAPGLPPATLLPKGEPPTDRHLVSLASLQGMVYEDLNLNQVYDQGEPGLSEAVVILSDGDQHQISSQRTGVDGRYNFTGINEPGTYCLRALNPPGYQPTTATELCVPLGAADVNFGFRRVPSPTAYTPTLAPTSTATAGPSPTPSMTATPSITGAWTATPSNTPTATRTPTITRTPTGTATSGPSPTPTLTPVSWIDLGQAMPAHCTAIFAGDTTGKPNNASYYGNLTWLENGPEDVYILHKTVVSDLTVDLEWSSTDLDIFLLYSPHPSALLAWDDKAINYPDLAPGTYYIVVDGFNRNMGQYRLTVECAGEPTPTATATFTPSPTLIPTATNTPGYTFYPLLYKMPTPTPTSTPTPTDTPTPVPYLQAVDCGSAEGYAASDGAWYAPDQRFVAGGWGWDGDIDQVLTAPADIADTNDDVLYRTQREAMAAYRFAVPRGRYEVLLRFAEIFTYIREDRRVFDVSIENERVSAGLDIYALVRRNRALDLTFTADVVDGVLDITFVQVGDEFSAGVNAIRVRRVGNVD